LWWGYIVAFTKVLTIYQVCHSCIHPPHHSPLPPPSPIPAIGSTGLIFPFTYVCTHIYTTFTLLHPFPTFPPSHWYEPPHKQGISFLRSQEFACWKEMQWGIFHQQTFEN
jgi:hypothetical protein